MDLHTRRPLYTSEKLYSLAVIIIPLLMTIVGIVFLCYYPLLQGTIWLFVAMYSFTVFGISVGFHRLLTHRSFTPARIVKWFFVIGGCMAYQGPPLFWVSSHRRHHKFVETEGDPHSPHTEKGFWRNLYHAHIGWMMKHELEDWDFYAKDLLADKDILFMNRHYFLIAIAGIVLPGVINGLIYMSWMAGVEGILIAGFMRTFLVHQVTWSINSITHLFGYTNFRTSDKSKNSWLFGLLGYGEGWHNNHHAFPYSAKLGMRWFEIDFGYYAIKLCSMLGLASKIKFPSREQMDKKRSGDLSNKPLANEE